MVTNFSFDSLVYIRRHIKPFKLTDFGPSAQEIYIAANEALARWVFSKGNAKSVLNFTFKLIIVRFRLVFSGNKGIISYSKTKLFALTS